MDSTRSKMQEIIEAPEGGQDITPEDSIVPVFLVPLTPEQEADREKMEANRLELEASIAGQEAARESAVSKLTKLGLTLEEARALTGNI
jgi:hypothetical protein